MSARSLLSSAYRRCAAPLGLRALDSMLADGLPEALALPLRFLFDGKVSPRAGAIADEIERVRVELASRSGTYTLPSTSVSHPPVLTWAWLANHVSVQRRWGLFLHLLAEAFAARNVLELGSCVGISGAFLASASHGPRLVSIEASPELAPVAAATIARFTANGTVLHGMFDERLPDAIEGPVGLAYIDGHHDGDATIRYVESIVPHLDRGGAVIVLDDIRLYEEMIDAWRSLRAMPGIGAAVDVGRFGLLVWGEGDGTLHDLARYTGWWRVGGRRSQRGRPMQQPPS